MSSYCQHHSDNDCCPISKTPCYGECIYADIMENIELGIIVIDCIAQTIVYQNKNARLYCDHNPFVVQYINDHLLVKSVTETSSGFNQLQSTITFQGRTLGYSVYNVSENHNWVFLKDVTEVMRLESIAEALNTADNIGYVLSGIRHEIGNPVNSIKMALSVLRNNLGKYSRETILEYLDKTLNEIKRVEYLLKAMRNFNMFERPEPQDIKLKQFLQCLVELVKTDFERQGVPIQLDDNIPDCTIRADPRLLHQVMLNMLTNASDAVIGHAAKPLIRIVTFIEPGLACLFIIDNGCGIPLEQQKELFKPFYTSKPHGTGMGLVISRNMLAKMGCTIDIESWESEGTSVKIAIPRAQTHA